MADLDIRIRMDSSGAESSTRNLTQAVLAIGAQATRSQGVLANMMIGFNQGLELARKAMQAIQGVFDSTVGSAMKFESALKEVTTLFNSTAEDQARLTEEVLRFQKQFGADVINTTKAYYQAISSGAVDATTAQELMVSANKLAIGGVTDVETAVNGLTNAISGFGLTASDSTRISDLLFIGMKNGKTTVGELSGNIGLVSSTANALGISLEETVASMSALTTAGISTNVATTQLKALMTNLVKPTDELSKAFKQAGIESIDLALKQDGLIGVLGKIKGTTDGSASSLQKLFGSVEAGSAVLSLTGEQAKTFNKNMLEMGEASKNVGATTEEAFSKITASAEYQMNLLKGNVSAVFTEIGIAIIPILASALQTVNEAFKNSGEVVNSIKSTYSTYKEEIIALGAFLGTLGVALAAHAIAVNISSIAWGAYTIATNIATVATTAFTAVMAVLTSPITAVVVALGALVAGIVYYTRNQDLCNGYIKQFAAFVLDLVIPSINVLIDSFVETQRGLDILGGGLQIAMGYFSKLVSFITSNVISGFDVFLLAIQEVVGVFDKDMAQSIENTRNKLKGFSQSLKDSSDAMIENGRETIKNALTSEEYGNKKEDLKNKVKALSDSLMQEGMAQVDLAKKQDATKEGLKEVAQETTKLQKDTMDLTDEKNNQTGAIEKNSSSLEKNKSKKDENSKATKDLIQNEKTILANFESQSKAIDEITKQQDKYIESLQKTRDEIGNQKGLADGISGALKLINTSVELQAISDVLGAEKVAIQVVEAERMKSFGNIEESELIYQKLRADAEVELSKEQIKAVERKKEREAKSIKENAITFKEVMQQSLEYVSIGYDAIKSVISTSLDYFKQGIDLISGSLYNNITQSIALLTSIPENLEKSFDGFSKIITEGIPQAIEKMPQIVDKIIKETPKIISSLEKNLPKLIDVIVESIPKILPPMIKAFTSAFLAIIPKIPALISAIVKEMPTLIRGVMKVIPALIKEVPKILDVILKEIPSIIKEFVDGLPDIIKALVRAIPQIISSLISNLPDIIMALIMAIPQIMDAVIAEIPNLIEGIIKNLPQLIASLIENIPQIALALINAIISLVGSVIDAFIPGFSDGVQEVFGKIIEQFNKVWEFLNENVFKPIISGFTMLFQWVYDYIFAPIILLFTTLFNFVYNEIFKPIINFLKTTFQWVYDSIFMPIYMFFYEVFQWIYDSIFTPIYQFFKDTFDWIKINVFDPIYKSFKDTFNWIKINVFDPVVKAFDDVFKFVDSNIIQPIKNLVKEVKNIGSVSVSKGQWYDPGEWFSKGSGWFSKGGMVGYSNGGIVGNNGIDSKQYDTVPAMLSKGEIVLPKSAVKGGLPSMVSFIQDVLGMQKQQYAFGGMVDLAQAGKGTMSISNVSSSNTALNDEIKNLRNEIRAIGTALLRDTVSINRTMTQWNGEGLPSDRGY